MGNRSRQIAIITDDPGWHGRQLGTALRTYGFESQFVTLADSKVRVEGECSQIYLPGFGHCLPLGVFVRGIPGGTLEQVIFRLDILHILAEKGIIVYNNPRAIERTVDKVMTSFLLQRAGIPTPPTWACESVETAYTIYQRESSAGHQLVLKPMFGSQGNGIQLLDKDLKQVEEQAAGGIFYLQHFIEPVTGTYQDFRVFVIDGVAVAGMTRSHHEWITNRSRGAECRQVALNGKIRSISELASKACAIDYAGVDIILDTQGQMQVLEVNSIPAWWGLQRVIDVDIASLLIDSFVAKVNAITDSPHAHGGS